MLQIFFLAIVNFYKYVLAYFKFSYICKLSF